MRKIWKRQIQVVAVELFPHLQRVRGRPPGQEARTGDLWAAYYRRRGGEADSCSDFKTRRGAQLIETGQLLGSNESHQWGQIVCYCSAASTGARHHVEGGTEARLGGCY